jgi:hypothetical protein
MIFFLWLLWLCEEGGQKKGVKNSPQTILSPKSEICGGLCLWWLLELVVGEVCRFGPLDMYYFYK